MVKDLDVPFSQCGAVMPAVNPEQLNQLPKILEDAYKNHVYDVEMLSHDEVLAIEPEINPEVLGGLLIPSDSVIDPFLFVVAMAENAAENGVEFILDCQVTGLRKSNGCIEGVETTKGFIGAAGPSVIQADTATLSPKNTSGKV